MCLILSINQMYYRLQGEAHLLLVIYFLMGICSKSRRVLRLSGRDLLGLGRLDVAGWQEQQITHQCWVKGWGKTRVGAWVWWRIHSGVITPTAGIPNVTPSTTFKPPVLLLLLHRYIFLHNLYTNTVNQYDKPYIKTTWTLTQRRMY